MLSTIGASLLALPGHLKVARERRLEEEQRRREAEQRRWKAERLERLREERLAELVKEAGKREDLESVTNYLDHLEKKVASGMYVVTENLTRGLARARELLTRLDPTERRIGILQKHGMVTLSECAYGGCDDGADEA